LAVYALPAYSQTQWAVVVGVSEYKVLPKEQWLHYPDADAKLYADYLKSPLVGVPAANVKLLLNSEATTSNIKNLLGSWLPENVQPDDIVYVYFAGHGIVDKRGDAYFVTNDTDPAKLYASAYSMLDLKGILGRLKYRHLVVISDACHAGSIGAEADTSRDLEVVRINDAFKGIVSENESVAKSEFILTAAGSNEKSFESDRWDGGHGAFTYFLVDGLKGKADRDGNGKVTANEIYDYVRDAVRRETNDQQHPIVASTKFDNNLILSSKDGGASIRTVASTASTSSFTSRDPGSVLLTTNVSGVRVSIDSTAKGTIDPTGQKLVSLDPGSHTVTAQKDGYKPITVTVTVPPADQVVVPIKIVPTAASSAPEFAGRFTNAQQLVGINESAATEEFQGIFNSLLTTKSTRPLLADEMDLVNGAFVGLVQQHRKTGALEEIGSLTQTYLTAFSFLPDAVVDKLPEDFRASVEPNVASFQFDIQPAQSALEIDSEWYGPMVASKKLIVRPGSHTIRISGAGFKTLEKQIDVAAGQTETVKDRLGLSGITLFVLSETPGVQVLQDGKRIATVRTSNEALANLRPDQKERLRQVLDRRPANPSLQVAVLSELPPDSANLRLTFTRDKYSTQEAALNFGSNLDRIYDAAGDVVWDGVVRLDKLMGTLDITSFPSGADVLIDNKKVGTTPFQAPYEIGDADLLVRSGVWKQVRRISIKDHEAVKIDLKLQAPITYLGIQSATLDPQKYRTLDGRIKESISKSFSNYVGEAQDPNQYEYMKEFVADAASGKGGLDQRLKTLKERFNSDLFLIGYFPTENAYLSNTLTFFLFSTYSANPDVRQVDANRPGALETFFKELDSVTLSPADLFRPYLGLSTLDTLLTGHELVVLSVDAGGPAAKAGIARGDTILSMNGAPGTSFKLAEWTDRNPVGTPLQIDVQSASGRKMITLKSEPLPRFIVKPGMTEPMNSLMVQFEYMRFSLPPKPGHESNIVLLNQALAQMALQSWARAIEILNNFSDAAENATMLRPAVDYYRGFCFEQLADNGNARRSYTAASQQQIRLLQSDLAFDFQTLAQWRLDYLK
jgi:hypothetical protein